MHLKVQDESNFEADGWCRKISHLRNDDSDSARADKNVSALLVSAYGTGVRIAEASKGR
jgi:hypothetical protein